MKAYSIFKNRNVPSPHRAGRIHRRWHSNRHPGSGFTLIEIIVTLILVGILATMAGFGIVQAVQGYMFSRGNAELTQKAQLAMSRITREIVEMTGLISNQTPTKTSLPIANVERNVILGLHSNTIKVAPEGTSLSAGDVLIDNVNAFNLTYWKGDDAWDHITHDIRELSAIDITLTLNRPDGGTMEFRNRVAPRNNKNLGGEPPDIEPPTMPSYNLCFVATAAFGNDTHPAVVLLREFRDHFLLTWKGGRWLVDQYYTHGPILAGMIENRPLAQWAARMALYPVALLTFLVLYAPWAGLAVILILGFLAKILISHKKETRKIVLIPSSAGQNGSILIGLIGAIVVMSALGAAMLPMFSSSYMNQAYSDHGRKAYFLAESGFRYVASEYLNAGSTSAKDAVLAEIHEKTFNLNNNQGSFTTRVYPFWTESSSFSGSTLSSTISGTIPDELKTGTGGYIRVGTGNDFYSYSSRTGTGTTVTFQNVTPASGVASPPPMNQDVLLVVIPTSTSNVTEGGSITINNTGADALPLLNGNFTLSPSPTGIGTKVVFNYEKRTENTHYNTLHNITLADANQSWSNFQVTGGDINTATKIVLEQFLRLSSTGNYQGSSREIVYNVPLGWLPEGSEFKKEQFHDTFNSESSESNWFMDGSLGGHDVTSNVMQVETLIQPGQTQSGLLNWLGGILGWIQDHGQWAAVVFDWSNVNTNLAQAWHDAGGNLSYDIQVKVNNTQPYFFAGLGFRMRSNSAVLEEDQDLYSYGVSFVRQRQTRGLLGSFSYDDGIHDDLRPPYKSWTAADYNVPGIYAARYSEPAIILWQRTGPASTMGEFKLLAYKYITDSDLDLTDGTGVNLRLKPWSTLMVRLVEGYELPFSSGRVDASGRHLKYGDRIRNAAGSKSARVIGTPVMSTAWGGNNTFSGVGRLILTNTVGSFNAGEQLFLEGGDSVAYATSSGALAANKANYIMVYYSDDKTPEAGNDIQADNIRIGNQRSHANWPPDDWTDRAADKDHFTLVRWYDDAPGENIAPELTSPNWSLGNAWQYETSPDRLRKFANGSNTANRRAQPNPALTIVPGQTYTVSVTIADWERPGFLQTAELNYSLGGVQVASFWTSRFLGEVPNGTHTHVITATSSANLVFEANDNSRFRITDVSVRPHGMGPTLDTTADGQGNTASYVPALNSTDFYQAVIKTSALVSPTWSAGDGPEDFAPPGDHIALITSSSAGTSTQYDDFAIQLDMKAGSGFLPPIQQ